MRTAPTAQNVALLTYTYHKSETTNGPANTKDWLKPYKAVQYQDQEEKSNRASHDGEPATEDDTDLGLQRIGGFPRKGFGSGCYSLIPHPPGKSFLIASMYLWRFH